MTGYQSKKKAAQDKLAQPAQEPVGKFAKFTDGVWREVTNGSAGIPLYTHPPQRTWVGLTDEDMSEIEKKAGITENDDGYIVSQIFKLTDAKLKDKNI